MRRLMLAACAAPLVFAAGAAFAQTSVTTTSTTPLATATAGDIDVAASGAISTPTATPLITLNSNNKVTLEGSLVSNNTNNATGVLIYGGNTGSFTSTGTINLGSDYVAKDTANNDGVVEAPFATNSGKAGVRLIGAAPFTGDITLGGAGIGVKGNNSFGVSIEAPLTGSLLSTAPISLLGDNSTAVRVLAPVSGAISVSGAVTATGAGAKGIDLQADAGTLRLYSPVTTTGYSLTSRPSAVASLVKIQATPLDMQQGGSAVTVAGSLANGLYIGGAPTGTVAGSLVDLTGDGVADGAEGAGSIITYGAAPALLVGAAGKTLSFGQVGVGPAGYGLIVRGAVLGAGVYDGVTGTGAQLGAGGGLNIAGGVLLTGSITGSAYEADAIGVHVLSGTTAPIWMNQGVLGATVNDSAATAALGSASAQALLIEAGASLPSFTNTGQGSVIANTVGNGGVSAAIVDRSGTLSTVVNEGVISAGRSTILTTAPVTGANIALDLRANTTGVSLLQKIDTDTAVTYGSTAGTTDTATSAFTAPTPKIIGDVLLGSGPNSVTLQAGTLTGVLDLGSNTASLKLSGASAYYGALRYTGSALALAVTNGTLTQLEATTLKLSSLQLGAAGTLNLALDPVNGTSSLLQVSGSANIENGAKIGVQLLSSVSAPQTFTLISSPNLTVGSSDANLLASGSFLVKAALHSDTTAGTVTVTLTPRTSSELGLNASEGGALSAIVDGARGESAVSVALLAAQDSASFTGLYRQLLPEHSNGIFHAVDQATRAIADLATDRNDLFKAGSVEGGVWMEQFLLGSREKRDIGQASETAGFGLVGGATTGDSELGAFGLTLAYVNASTSDPDLAGDGTNSFSHVSGGLNWKGSWHGLEFAARGGGGWLWGVTRRQFIAEATPYSTAVSRSTKGTWNGWTADARASMSYRVDLGRYFVQPQARLDYIKLEQQGYTERFGGDSLNMVVGDRSASAASVTGSVLFGAKFGQTGAIRPTFEVGVRDVFSGDAGSVSAAFATGGNSFVLSSTPITGAGALARMGLKYTGTYVEVELAAKAQAFERYQEGDLRVAVSTRF